MLLSLVQSIFRFVSISLLIHHSLSLLFSLPRSPSSSLFDFHCSLRLRLRFIFLPSCLFLFFSLSSISSFPHSYLTLNRSFPPQTSTVFPRLFLLQSRLTLFAFSISRQFLFSLSLISFLADEMRPRGRRFHTVSCQK